MTTKAGGPDWDKVVKKKTWTNDGQGLESVMIRDKPEDYDWHQQLDTPQDTITYLWYIVDENAKSQEPRENTYSQDFQDYQS